MAWYARSPPVQQGQRMNASFLATCHRGYNAPLLAANWCVGCKCGYKAKSATTNVLSSNDVVVDDRICLGYVRALGICLGNVRGLPRNVREMPGKR
eukprot:3244332-Amphidinium_carterae.1